MTLALLASPWRPELLGLVVACLALIVSMNRQFYRFMAHAGAGGLRPSRLRLHYVYYCCCGLSVVIALGLWHLRSPLRCGRTANSTRTPAFAATLRSGLGWYGKWGRDGAGTSTPPTEQDQDKEALAMDQSVNVAVVRSDNRRGASAQALALIADDLRACVTPEVLVEPNLVSHRYQPAFNPCRYPCGNARPRSVRFGSVTPPWPRGERRDGWLRPVRLPWRGLWPAGRLPRPQSR